MMAAVYYERLADLTVLRRLQLRDGGLGGGGLEGGEDGGDGHGDMLMERIEMEITRIHAIVREHRVALFR